MSNDSEPAGRQEADGQRADNPSLRDVIFAIGAFAAFIVFTSILAVLFIWFAQTIGWWEVTASAGAEGVMPELSAGSRVRAAGPS